MLNKSNFVAIIKENEGIIYKITRVYTNTPEDQKDLYQEVVYQLWKSFDSFKGNAKISTWMYRVALNTAIAFLNRRKKNVPTASIDFELHQLADEGNQQQQDQFNQLYATIGQLNIIEKGLILLFLEGKSYDEIAAISGFSTSNVGTKLSRIKKKIKENIKNS